MIIRFDKRISLPFQIDRHAIVYKGSLIINFGLVFETLYFTNINTLLFISAKSLF